MTLQEARDTYLNKVCDIDWSPIERASRPNETISRPTTDVLITNVYENCHKEIFFTCKDKIYTPFPIQRLRNPRA